MGLFNRLKKEKKQENLNMQVEERPYEINFTPTNDGGVAVDFYDKKADFKQFYDTTRLIISGKMIRLGNQYVNNCWVSHYGREDACIFDPTTGKGMSLRAKDYTQILSNIDIQLLQTDENYCQAVMKGLLNEKRIEKYINTGLQENPEQPCGIYVGEIRRTENGYRKIFDAYKGRECHNSPYMQKVRKEHREKLEINRQKKIQEKQEKMAKIQSEIDELNFR